MDKEFESSLVVMVPEVEGLVRPFRMKYDPAAAVGVPAHITINYPFQLDESAKHYQIAKLRKVFSGFTNFGFLLTEIHQFPNAIYLAPDPASRFVELSLAIIEHFPESPLYGGIFDEVIPHLTVAEVADFYNVEAILEKFTSAAAGHLPIRSVVKEVLLMDNRNGTWETRETFSLQSN